MHHIVHVRCKSLHGSSLLGGEVFRGLSGHNAIGQIPAHVIVEVSDHVKVDSLLQNLLGAAVDALLIHGKVCLLKEESLSECLGQALDLIIELEHPDVIEWLCILKHHGCKLFGQTFELMLLPDIYEQFHCSEVAHVRHLRDLVDGILLDAWHWMLAFSVVSE